MQLYQIKQLTLGGNETNCWIVVYGDAGDSRHCAIIDPGEEPDKIIKELEELALRPGHILLTHGHFDHIGALPALHSRYPEAVIAIHREDAPYLGHEGTKLQRRSIARALGRDIAFELPGPQPPADRELKEGDEVGPFKVLSTPGHTPGSVVFLLEEQKMMFSGDTLFKETCGRVDLPGGNQRDMEKSLQRLLALDGDIQVLPGHGESTSIAAERGTRFF